MLCLVNTSDLEVLDGRGRPLAVADDDGSANSLLLEIREERCVVKAMVEDEGGGLLLDVD